MTFLPFLNDNIVNFFLSLMSIKLYYYVAAVHFMISVCHKRLSVVFLVMNGR